MIPHEAVEAAARMMAQPEPYSFEKYPQHWTERARIVLEAAAPYLLAQAFEEAADELEYGNPVGSWLSERAESYRTQEADRG